MQDIRTNELMAGDSLDDLREHIPEEDQGPTFETGEVVRVKGYYYCVVEIQPNRLTFAPHGPRKDGHGSPLVDFDKLDRKARRPGQK